MKCSCEKKKMTGYRETREHKAENRESRTQPSASTPTKSEHGTWRLRLGPISSSVSFRELLSKCFRDWDSQVYMRMPEDTVM